MDISPLFSSFIGQFLVTATVSIVLIYGFEQMLMAKPRPQKVRAKTPSRDR